MTSPLKVLVVDDDPSILEICADALESDGYTVARAADGEQAVRLVAGNGFEVILMDVMMPRMDGITACQKIRGNPATAHIRIALMSARGNLNPRNLVLACADAVIAKPFDLDQMLRTIQDLAA